MSISRSSFLCVLLGLGAMLLPSCSQFSSGSKDKDADAVQAKATPTAKVDPDDPGFSDPVIPDFSSVKGTDSKVQFDPFGTKKPKVPTVEFKPDVPVGDPTQPREQQVAALPIPKAGVEEPTFKPAIVTLTYLGGAGHQWIQEVGFTSDNRIFARGGGGHFTAYYSADGGKLLEVEGDLAKASSGPKGPNVNTKGNGAFKATCPTSKVQLEIGYEAFGMKTQPYLNSSADWKWWGWKASDMGKGMEANARGIRVHWLHDGRFLAKVFADNGNSTVAKDPRNLKEDCPALATALLRNPAGAGTLYLAGNIKTGIPGLGTFVKGKALAEAVDPWERVYVGLPYDARNVPDGLKIGGVGGFCVLNANMTICQYSGTLGADHIYCMAIKDNMLVLGGNIGVAVEPDPKVAARNLPAAKLPVRNPTQAKPGGDEDGFLAIIKLW